jgi:hypothetical protein
VATDSPTASQLDTIVLLGAFNPLILSPQWFADNEIVSPGELEQLLETGKSISSRDFALLEFRAFQLQAEPDRVQFALTEEAETPMLLADVVVNTFTLLGHTPVRAIGLNHTAHREVDIRRRDQVLDRLAPRAPVEDVLSDLRLETLTWSGQRDDGYAGRVGLTVEPSRRVEGLFFAVNDHYDLGDGGTGARAAELIGSQWQVSLERAEALFETIVSLS